MSTMRKLNESTPARVVMGLALSALAAGLLVLAFPPFNLWFLVWFSFVPYILAQHRVMPWGVSSLASAAFNGLWLWGYLGPVFGGSGNFMAYLPLIVAGISLLVDSGSRRFHARTGYRWFIPQGLVAWVGIEMIRIFIPIAGTWGFVAYTLHGQPWLIQPASIFGIFGVSALIILVNYALGQSALRLWDRWWASEPEVPTPARALTRRWLAIAGVTLALWLGLSLLLFAGPRGETVRVAAIQPNASPIISANLGQGELVAQLHARMVEQTREAAAQGAEVIVWPEGAQLIAVPSNDWPGIAHKHYTHVVFRAIENRTAMVKADGGYDSAVVDPYGRVLSLSVMPSGGEATLVTDVPLGSGSTVAVRLGDWFGWLCLAAMAFFVVGESRLVQRAATG